jgi:hypothetical protein
VERVNQHVYYWYSPVASILALPFVAVSDLQGLSPVAADGLYDPTAEETIEVFAATLLMAVLAVLFYSAARLVLSVPLSIGLALVGALGSQVWSSASRALWTQTWGILLLGAIVLLLLAAAQRRIRLPALVLGSLVAGTYLLRPSYSLQVAAISVYVLLVHRGAITRYVVGMVPWLGLFVAYSLLLFQRPLPSYYSGGTASGGGYISLATVPGALLGSLISPSRGLLVFLPWVLVVFYLLARYWRNVPHRPLVALAAACIGANFLSVAVVGPWWGGDSYGPRLLADSVPWFVLLAVLGSRARFTAAADRLGSRRDRGGSPAERIQRVRE